MYRDILVPVDNSEWSNRAIDLAVELGRTFGAKLTGCHVYPAALHGYRFKQMEYTLPPQYRDEAELERQRAVHGSLIALGLRLISESYLDAMAGKVSAAGLAFERKVLDGRHYRVLAREALTSGYDVVVMGALGMGAGSDSQLGSVTERVLRRVPTDTIVVRRGSEDGRPQAIIVCLDGSPQSFTGLRAAITLAKALRRPLSAVVVNESPRAGEVNVPPSRLDSARTLAAGEGVALPIVVLGGGFLDNILRLVREEQPWLLVVGRAGTHSDGGETELGPNTATLLRRAPCNVLVAGRHAVSALATSAPAAPRGAPVSKWC